jgi:ribonuclease BN (tRNA processing enzyme)
MKFTFLGSGSAFTVGADNFHSNMILTSDRGTKLLIDCGSDIRFSLYLADFTYLDITDIYISHLHADHAGGLEYIGLNTMFDPRCDRPNLYLSSDLASEIWDRTLSGGMRSVSGAILELESFFKVHKIDLHGHFFWEGIKFTLVKVIHVDNGFFVIPSYGLFFTVDGVNVFLTTDARICKGEDCIFYEQADIIFQDCETAPFPTNVHAHYTELVELPAAIKHKMWLYHYQPGSLPNAEKDGFQGFVKRGQVFDFANLSLTSCEP